MGRKKVGQAEIDTGLLSGSWRRLVLSAPHLEPGEVDWKAYTFCVLEQAHRLLRRKEVFAKNSSKWGDPRASCWPARRGRRRSRPCWPCSACPRMRAELPRVSWGPRSCDQAVCGTSSRLAQYACSYSSGGV
ncbi:hypothetical protein GCM10010502_52480 [Kitasatospora aureofaciens]|uniref:Uncharacterized protein n=1 Tax=Kitasatospora aureofaciens TaxID=1894 RepID=A0A8H9HXJ6_KITAU|nr:hypothetical protein GCM10010502_52480 [Kitasatospora aureofaciens]